MMVKESVKAKGDLVVLKRIELESGDDGISSKATQEIELLKEKIK